MLNIKNIKKLLSYESVKKNIYLALRYDEKGNCSRIKNSLKEISSKCKENIFLHLYASLQ